MPDSQETAVGIDVGGGSCRAARVDASGAIRSFHTCATPDRLDLFLDAIRGLLRAVVDPTAASAAVGIGLPGIVDPQTGVMRTAVNLPFLDGSNVSEIMSDALARPGRIEADVNAATFAQWRRRPERPRRFAYVSIGTGVGVAVVIDGELIRHTDRGAGHWGHVPIDGSLDAPLCRCGARGCLEAVIGGANWDPAIASSDEQIDVAATALAVACRQIAAVYAPDLIALGGGVVDNRPKLVQAVARRVEDLRGGAIPPAMRIERAVLSSDEAGVIGASLLALEAGRS